MTSTRHEPGVASFLVFGYGSLIWRPPPHVARRIPGYITTHLRRFWQLSQDHRGTAERPGRVVTLIERQEVARYNMDTSQHSVTSKSDSKDSEMAHRAEADRCWGVVYEIIPEAVAEVIAYLTQREINGYSRVQIPVHTVLEGTIQAYVFIGTSDNPQYSPLPDVEEGLLQAAKHIARSSGPSGRNDDYLYNLETSLRELQLDVSRQGNEDSTDWLEEHGCGDWYVEELVRLVKAVQHFEET